MSAVLTTAPRAHPGWRSALPAFVLVVAALLALFREAFAGMYGIWMRSDTFAHGILVPPIVLWLVWRRRAELAAIAPQPQPWLLPLLLVAGAGWLVGALATVNAATQFFATAMLVLAVPAVLGLAVARALLFPLAFLFFMVPVGEFLLPLLMELTADFTVAALRLSGVPVYREGLQFVIPTGYWSVVEACSGVRYLIASFMVGSLFGYLNYTSARRRWIFAGVSIVVPILANWVRAYMIVMLGHLSGNRIAVGVDHLIYGWVFFGIVIGLMFFIGARWSEAPVEAAKAEDPSARAAAGSARFAGSAWAAVAATVAVLALPPLAMNRIEHQVLTGTPQLALPASLPGGWTRTAQPAVSYRSVWVGAAADARATYRNGEREVTLEIAYYRGQRPGHKLVSSDNVLLRSEDKLWNLVSQRHAEWAAAPGRVWPYREAEIRPAVTVGVTGHPVLEVRTAYWAGGAWASRAERATLQGLAGRLTGQGDDGAGVVVWSSGVERAEALATLDGFLPQALPEIEKLLAGVRAAAAGAP